MEPGIKSRPIYAPLQLDPAGRSHLIISDQGNIPRQAFTTPIDTAEIWLIAEAGFPDKAALFSALALRLQHEAAGFRLYAVGTEAFIWDAANIARAAGMAAGEFFITQYGSQSRRVYCVHCRHMTENVQTNIVGCGNCGANLFVRDHFSRRLAAFMGVQADAEAPGELPSVEILYP